MYVVRRLLYLPVSLLLLSLVVFGLRSLSPYDPVLAALPAAEMRTSNDDPTAFDRQYRRTARRLGLDVPAFYFSVQNAALPDTLYRITRPAERKFLRAMTLDAGDWGKVAKFHTALREVAYAERGEHPPATGLLARQLLQQDDPARVRDLLSIWERAGTAPKVAAAYRELYTDVERLRLLGVKFRWHGTDNQYHHWLIGLLTGELGTSTLDKQPVATKIGRALPTTLLLSSLSLLIVLAVSIPLGLSLASRAGSRYDKLTTTGLFILFGIPSFWLATLLANFLTTPAYGMDFFPSMGLGGDLSALPWHEAASTRMAHLVLPLFCFSYPSTVYVSRLLRASALEELSLAYVRTARMKGLSERRILFGHVLRNASFPLISILSTVFPALLAGSILIEQIFNLPGMGRLLYEAAVSSDWPVILALVMLNGVLTAIGLLIADLLYTVLDPRVELAPGEVSRPISLH